MFPIFNRRTERQQCVLQRVWEHLQKRLKKLYTYCLPSIEGITAKLTIFGSKMGQNLKRLKFNAKGVW